MIKENHRDHEVEGRSGGIDLMMIEGHSRKVKGHQSKSFRENSWDDEDVSSGSGSDHVHGESDR